MDARDEQVCDLLPRIGVTVDTFHANIEEEDISNAKELLGPYLKHINASENDRGILGQGHVDFGKIISVLRKVGYDGYLMIEGFGFSSEEQFGPGMPWANTNVSPEQFAATSAKFLRQHLGEARMPDEMRSQTSFLE